VLSKELKDYLFTTGPVRDDHGHDSASREEGAMAVVLPAPSWLMPIAYWTVLGAGRARAAV
jgi:hypothetical protein